MRHVEFVPFGQALLAAFPVELDKSVIYKASTTALLGDFVNRLEGWVVAAARLAKGGEP